MENGLVITLVGVALLLSHPVADLWIQTDHQAANKGTRDWTGRWNCAKHATTYTLTTVAAAAVLLWVGGVIGAVSLTGAVVATILHGGSHYWIDRRFTLRGVARCAGKLAFYERTTPLVGSYLLDQAAHHGMMFVALLFLVWF
jgi:hypothetical protein